MGYNITNLDFEKNSETNIQYCSKRTGYFDNLNHYDNYEDWENPKRIDLLGGNDIYIVDSTDHKQIYESTGNGIDTIMSYVDYTLPLFDETAITIQFLENDVVVADQVQEIENLILLEESGAYEDNYIKSVLADGTL